jgi:hypothetical protein
MTQKRKTLEVMNAERDEFNKLGNFANCKTLRDEFAMYIIAGFTSNDADVHWLNHHGAKYAYEIADAMLEARHTPPKEVSHD